jgi:hypothetical protein
LCPISSSVSISSGTDACVAFDCTGVVSNTEVDDGVTVGLVVGATIRVGESVEIGEGEGDAREMT